MFMTNAIPVGAGPAQVKDMRNAFYSGAAALFDVMTNSIAAIEDDNQCVAETFAIEAELTQYAIELANKVLQKGQG